MEVHRHVKCRPGRGSIRGAPWGAGPRPAKRLRPGSVSSTRRQQAPLFCFVALTDSQTACDERESVIGDFEEFFNERLVPEYGVRLAQFWYWTQVLRSVALIIGNSIWNLAKLVGKASGIAWLLRIVGG